MGDHPRPRDAHQHRRHRHRLGFDTPDGYLDHNSKGDALLDQAACPSGRLAGQLQGTLDASNLKGIWSEACFIKAAGG